MPIKTSVVASKPTAVKGDVLVLPVYQNSSLDARLPAAARREIQGQMRKLKFTGRWGTTEILPAPARLPYQLIAVVGLGKQRDPVTWRAEGWRRGLAKSSQEARHRLARSLVVLLPMVDGAALAAAGLEAVTLADYRFTEHKRRLAQEQKIRSLRQAIFLSPPDQLAAIRAAVKQAQEVLVGVSFTRDLVNQPASHITPRHLVALAKLLAKKSPRLSVKILNRQQTARAGFSAFLAVARGSAEEPYVIHLQYRPAGPPRKKIILIGKGVTFDSGGLSLKPAQYMESMKIDMAGAATVLGVFSVLPYLKLDIEVHGIIAACENMPSGNAYRPGDVLIAKNGKTIEIFNTDAEGRVTLADALSYAVEQKPDVIIDIATLTGACIVALGDTYAGLWSNRADLQDKLLEAAVQAGEGLVAFPLPEEYRSTIESRVADVRNTATVNSGGAVTAALFLQEFVNNLPWAHLDVAGPVYAERPMLPYYTYGATGYGVRTLVHFLQKY